MGVFLNLLLIPECVIVSMGIASVVDDNTQRESGGMRDTMCSTCEMAVVWMQNQLKQNQTQDRILNYVNEVNKTTTPFFFLL